MQNQHQEGKIIFFDGMCVLCNGAVDFLLRIDRKQKLKFASLQSGFAKSFMEKSYNKNLKEDTIVFFDEGRWYIKSAAVLRISSTLGLPYSALNFLWIIPRKWRDRIYDMVARNRVKWFGVRQKCRVADQETKGRILG